MILFEKMKLPFAKKTKTINIYSDTYNATVHSYTHKKDYDIVVSKEFLSKEDNVLIIDDFLAKGSALTALLMLIEKAGARDVYVYASHAVLSGPAIENLQNGPIKKATFLNTINVPEEKMIDKFILIDNWGRTRVVFESKVCYTSRM